jgi:hypothetical protein
VARGPPAERRRGAIPNSTQLGYVWIVRSDEDQANKLLREITAGVRIYLVWDENLDPLTPDDPTPLEQAGTDLETTLAPIQYGSDPWYFDVVSIEFNHGRQYLEAVVRGTRWNDSAVS